MVRRSCFILCSLLGLLTGCSGHKEIFAVLPDLAVLLGGQAGKALSIFEPLGFPPELAAACAGYPLLLPIGQDKNSARLPPSGSLPRPASSYCRNNNKGRAVYLFCKGCLEEKKGNASRAIDYYRKALDILEDCLSEVKLQSLLYSSLGDSYFAVHLDDEEMEMLQKLYKLNLNGLARISALNDISLCFYGFEDTDSSTYYVYRAIKKMISQPKEWENFHSNTGSLYLNGWKTDSSVYHLTPSIKNPPLSVRPEMYRELHDIEYAKGNYKAACDYIHKYLLWADSLNHIEQASNSGHLARKHDAENQLQKEKERSRHMLSDLILALVAICSVIILVCQSCIYRKKLLQLSQKNLEEGSKGEMHLIGCLKEEKLKFYNCLFTKTALYKKVVNLSNQKLSDKRKMKVLTLPEQEELQQTVFEIYADYISELRSIYPRLTEEDLLYLCLQQIPLDSLGMAICFGNSNTQVIYQRKFRLKEKMRGWGTRC